MFKLDKVDVHFNFYLQQPTDITPIMTRLAALEDLVRRSMEEFTTLLEQIDTETTRIADGIAALLERLNQGGLTPEQEATVKAGINTHLTRLRGIATDPQNPIPPEEPV